jgi:hypothetical protein
MFQKEKRNNRGKTTKTNLGLASRNGDPSSLDLLSFFILPSFEQEFISRWQQALQHSAHTADVVLRTRQQKYFTPALDEMHSCAWLDTEFSAELGRDDDPAFRCYMGRVHNSSIK